MLACRVPIEPELFRVSETEKGREGTGFWERVWVKIGGK